MNPSWLDPCGGCLNTLKEYPNVFKQRSLWADHMTDIKLLQGPAWHLGWGELNQSNPLTSICVLCHHIYMYTKNKFKKIKIFLLPEGKKKRKLVRVNQTAHNSCCFLNEFESFFIILNLWLSMSLTFKVYNLLKPIVLSQGSSFGMYSNDPASF